MFFSVLVPVYNTSKYLTECMDSILSQSFKDYEVVLLDDGSTDRSGLLCDDFANRYSFVRVIHKQNEGPMMARRRGFKEAKGKYFICIDSDDKLCDNNALEKIYMQIKNTQCDLVIYDFVHGAGPNSPEKIRQVLECSDGYIFEGDKKVVLYDKLLTTNSINSMCVQCLSREIVDLDIDYSLWKEDVCMAEDLFQVFPILNNAKRIVYINSPLYYYRWSPNSLSRNVRFTYYNSLRCIDSRADEYINRWNLPEEVKKRAIGQRIVGVTSIIVECYYSCKKNKRVSDWKKFIRSVSDDDYFINILEGSNRNEVSKYCRLLHYLITKKRINTAIWVIEVVRVLSRIK